MAKYVDGFVFTVPEKNLSIYKKMAKEASVVWKKFGALDYKECRANNLSPDMHGMKAWSFPKMVKPKQGEEIWFSFIVYKSKKDRDAVNKKVMEYFNKKYANVEMKMPFDMKRFCTAGFTVEVE
ncbi:MAG: RNA signal recognition particle [Candidatus Vogelbacteria bacterium CG10_big_fil_rev_8_21_14_0_10_45_14]|uniref:RNA signal recognition particle n=1 Tax=Candidatus Vogelbacteria bacterium CG10_big_fil_rev_8_21_14_0_10_45_14 TaxID=1975042 RepID=A0A2H0RKE0_9BACT|nr:MAG: RNA signal recognition particle [Candidatus Vogelbacteria bacterium CG10_big_fil_rev_8_21_14_0_10_45_14]